jgi:hypothetical protein
MLFQHRPRHERDALVTLAAFAIPFLVYLRTLAPTVHAMALADRPTVYGLDSAEFAAGAYTLGIVHAPGYPLYLLVGKGFSYLPFGDVAYRLNLMSAFFAALTVAVLYRLILRLTRHTLVSFCAALFLAFSYYFWTAAIVAEVYTLHAFLMALILLTLLDWQESKEARHLYRLALLYGLSFGNHTSTSLMAPGLLFFLLTCGYRQILHPRVFFGMALVFAAGLSVYLYLPWRYRAAPSFNYAGHYDAYGVFHGIDQTTLDGLWWMLSGRPFKGLMFSHRWSETVRELKNYAYWLWSNFLAVGIVPGVLGGARLFTTRGRFAVSLLLIYLANLVFFATYRILDTESMYIPTYLIWAVWMGIGGQYILDAITDWENQYQGCIDRKARISYNITWSKALKTIFFLVPITTLIINFRYCDLSDNWAAKENAQAMLDSAEPDAIILGWFLTAPPLEYLQVAEGQRPDVQVINRVFIGWNDLRRLIKQNIDVRPIYTIEGDPALVEEYEQVPLETGGYKLEKRTDGQ